MEKGKSNKSWAIFWVGVVILFSGCSLHSDLDTGIFAGVISIGPLCPVERPGDPACKPTAETYKAYPVSIYGYDGRRILERIVPALDGTFRIELPSGYYVIRLEMDLHGVGGSNLPLAIRINSGDTTHLNIDIDTGIR